MHPDAAVVKMRTRVPKGKEGKKRIGKMACARARGGVAQRRGAASLSRRIWSLVLRTCDKLELFKVAAKV